MCKYKHNTCAQIDREKKYPVTGVGCVILNKYNKRNIYNDIIYSVPVIYFIKERFGVIANKYSIIGGKLNKGENCYISAMLRELYEEAKIDVNIKDFGKFFKDEYGKTRYIWHNGTPIFIGLIKISRTILRRKILSDLINTKLDISHKETLDIDCVRLDNFKTLDGKKLSLSSYAESVLRNNNFMKYF